MKSDKSDVQLKQDMVCTHYQPASKSTWCGAMRRALDRGLKEWRDIRTTTNVSKVTCPDCLRLIREAVTGR